jgi:hypothetical protein
VGAIIKGFEIRTFGVHAPELAERNRAEQLDLPASGRIAPAVTPARDRPES